MHAGNEARVNCLPSRNPFHALWLNRVKNKYYRSRGNEKIFMRWPGIEPGSTAWKAAMLTTIPPSPYRTFHCSIESFGVSTLML